MMAPSSALFRYIARQFMTSLCALMTILMGVLLLFDTVELMRRAAKMDDIPLSLILRMSSLKLPYLMEQLLPMGVLFAAIHTCWKLNKTSELVVIRASGLSAWQFLTPLLACAMMAGVFSTAILNPVSSVLLGKYARLDAAHFRNEGNLVTVSRTGIWLRQPSEQGYALIHAETFDQKNWQLNNVIVLFFDGSDNFRYRYDSPTAYLKAGYWDISRLQINDRSGGLTKEETRRIPTELTSQKIVDSFADPETISFWSIPEYIRIMEQTGFPATRIYLHFHNLMAQPLLFAAMILLAATFSLRPQRFGGTAALVALGVATGFGVFFLQSFLEAFGLSQKIPVYLASWSPSLIGLLLGGTALLHLEDG